MDAFCDHLLVVDNAKEGADKIVGTYRLIRRAAAEKNGSFYSSSEFDIAPLIAFPGEIYTELRSCIAPAYRTGVVMNIFVEGAGGLYVPA